MRMVRKDKKEHLRTVRVPLARANPGKSTNGNRAVSRKQVANPSLCAFTEDPRGGIVCTICRRRIEKVSNVTIKRACTGPAPPMIPLELCCSLCPGDILTMTAAVESLHAAYPGQYLVAVRTSCDEIFENNPGIDQRAGLHVNCKLINCEYPTIHQSNQVHTPFLAGYTHHLAKELGKPIPLSTNRPHLYLSKQEELLPRKVSGPYWLINAGTKSDYPLKQWPIEYYQEVVDRTKGKVTFVQIGRDEHNHPRLNGVIDLVDKTTTRELVVLAYHSMGGVGPITFLQHICAAWSKPYIALLGGREPVTWTSYPMQHTLHTIGSLPCCATKACWKGKIWECERLIRSTELPVAKCMYDIKPAEVTTILERYV